MVRGDAGERLGIGDHSGGSYGRWLVERRPQQCTLRSAHATKVLRVTFLGPEGFRLRRGDDWPYLITGFARLCGYSCVAPLPTQSCFWRSVVKHSHGYNHERILDFVFQASETYNLLGFFTLHQHLQTAEGLAVVVTAAVPPERASDTCGLARPVDGPLDTALKGLAPLRTVKR